MAYASICLATDYDVWFEEDYVDVASVLANVKANVANVKGALRRAIGLIPLGKEHESTAYDCLKHAVMTHPDLISEATWERVALFLSRYIERSN